MLVKAPVHPGVKSYLEAFTSEGEIHYRQQDKLLSILFSLFRKPEISDVPLRVRTDTFIVIRIPKFLLDQGKTHLSMKGVELFERVVLLLLEKELFAFLDKTIVKGRIKQKEAIEIFYTTFRLPDFEKDYEKNKKAYYRYRMALEEC